MLKKEKEIKERGTQGVDGEVKCQKQEVTDCKIMEMLVLSMQSWHKQEYEARGGRISASGTVSNNRRQNKRGKIKEADGGSRRDETQVTESVWWEKQSSFL